MLFPAVHELGFKLGQKAHYLWYHQAKTDWSELLFWVWNFPALYKDWWWNLLLTDPVHVAVETTLLVSIIYMVFVRVQQEGYQDSKEKLSKAEKEELLVDWKNNRAPLAPPSAETEDTSDPQVVVHSQDGKYLHVMYNAPSKTSNSKQQKQQHKLQQVMNFCNFDFLGLQTSNVIKQASTEALKKYGCGSCGPRGFYGTIDTHLQLEEKISGFTNTDGAIMYSDGASTCSSTVSAFAKRGDILVVDEGVYEPLATGVYLSRANVHWFKHNDMDDLERILIKLQKEDKRLGRKPNWQRRFIVVEGLYKNLGTIAPLDKIVALKHQYHYRLILDESFSFGSLGKTGRGSLELHDQRPMHDVEIVTIALENALGSIGGVTVGNEEVVDHQRLSGAGYCFSASAPPFTASAAISALEFMEDNPKSIVSLQSNVEYAFQSISKKMAGSHLVITSDERSPILVLQLEQESKYEAEVVKEIMVECLKSGIAIVATGKDASSHLRTELAPAIRMTVSTMHTRDDIDKAVTALMDSAKTVLPRYPVEWLQ